MVWSIAVTTAAAISLQLEWLWALILTALDVDAGRIQFAATKAVGCFRVSPEILQAISARNEQCKADNRQCNADYRGTKFENPGDWPVEGAFSQ